MTILQKILQKIYPLRMKFSSATGLAKNTIMNTANQLPQVSFYSLTATGNAGKSIDFQNFKGKYVLVVNLASNCGFTSQYAELEKLYLQYQHNLVILGFPSNDFGSQEPGSDAEIAQFCQINYGVTFPLFTKLAVKGADRQPVYQWLSDPAQNGWNAQQPTWNFFKYLISPQGELTHLFSSAVSPLDADITHCLA